MKIELTDLYKVHRANLASKGLHPKVPEDKWYPTREWCQDNIHASHSTLEWANIYIEATVSGTAASHIVRHTKGHPRFSVESHRPDWTGKSRPPATTERTIMIKCSPYSFLEMARQRLCNLAHGDVKYFFRQVCLEMFNSGETFLSELGLEASPDCIFRGGVCHMHERDWKTCGMFPHWRKQ